VKKNNEVQSTYSYDANGNRLKKQTGAVAEVGTYDDQDRLLTYAGATYAYTAMAKCRARRKADRLRVTSMTCWKSAAGDNG